MVCLPKQLAQSFGNMSQVGLRFFLFLGNGKAIYFQIVLCLRVSNVITLIDPRTLQMADVQGVTFWRDQFESLCNPKMLTSVRIFPISVRDFIITFSIRLPLYFDPF